METKLISSSVSAGQVATSRHEPRAVSDPRTAKADASVVSQDQRTGKTVEAPVPNRASKDQAAEEIEGLVERLNTKSLTSSHTLRFSIDEKLGKAIISVVDRDTDEVIRQIPPETAIQIAEAFDEVTAGHLLSEQA